jgi:hypothetical protein
VKLTFSRRWIIIPVWEPRYHDRKVLLATYKIGEKNKVKILKGAFKGEYFISGVVASSYEIVSNGRIPCYAVPLSQLEKL